MGQLTNLKGPEELRRNDMIENERLNELALYRST